LKLTIDSTEALEDTLRVVGALYNVSIEASANAANGNRSDKNAGTSRSARPTLAAGARARRRRPGRRAPGKQGRAGTRANGRASAAAVRSWARANGYTIADRGRVPDEVLTAYQNA
jgi:hypothetical protein